MADTYRIGEAAEILGVRVETLRRWERAGRLKTDRTAGGQRLVPASEVARLLADDARTQDRSRLAARATGSEASSPRSRRDKLSATVEIQAGPHRILAFITREAVDQLGLKPGMEAVATVKATSVMVNCPSSFLPLHH